MNLLCVLAISFSTVAMAGQAAKDQRDQANGSKDTTLTGCLTAGASETSGEFILTEEGTGRKVMVTGKPELGKHANHKVKITGKNDTQSADRMTVTKIEHIAPSCVAR